MLLKSLSARLLILTIFFVMVGERNQHRASFETAASRLPQDEVLPNAIKEIPHPEEAHSAVSKDAGCSRSPSFANSFTSSVEGELSLA